jgi:hypothetical protein
MLQKINGFACTSSNRVYGCLANACEPKRVATGRLSWVARAEEVSAEEWSHEENRSHVGRSGHDLWQRWLLLLSQLVWTKNGNRRRRAGLPGTGLRSAHMCADLCACLSVALRRAASHDRLCAGVLSGLSGQK